MGLFVSISMVITLIIPTMAVNSECESDLWISSESVLSEMVEGYTPKTNSEGSATIENGVRYNYNMGVTEENGTYVKVDYSIDFGDQTLDFTVDGYVQSIPFGEDDIFYEGKLVGDKTINGIDYTIVAGIQKLESSDNIRIGIVMDSSYDTDESVIMVFGDKVLSRTDMSMYMSENVSANLSGRYIDNGVTDVISPMNEYDDYDLYCSKNLSIDEQDVSTNSAGTMYYYFAPDSLRGILALRSACGRIAGLLTNDEYIAIADVYNAYFEIDTVRGNGYIAGFENSVVYPKNSSFSINDEFRSGLVDIISYIADFSPFPIPTSFLSWISDNLTGRVITSDPTGTLTAEFQFTGILDSANFDDGLLPVTYQFDAGTGGQTQFKCLVTTEYRCRVIDYTDDSVTTLYLETEPGTYTWSFTE